MSKLRTFEQKEVWTVFLVEDNVLLCEQSYQFISTEGGTVNQNEGSGHINSYFLLQIIQKS